MQHKRNKHERSSETMGRKKQEEAQEQARLKPKVLKISKSLHVPLTEEEFKAHAIELAKLMGEFEALEKKLQSARSMFKSQMDETAARVAWERQLVQEGKEWRDTPCLRTFDYEAKMVITAVQETGEIIESRPMLLSEMQTEMDLEEPDQSEDPGEATYDDKYSDQNSEGDAENAEREVV